MTYCSRSACSTLRPTVEGNVVCSTLIYSLCMCRKLTSTTMVGMRLRRGYTAPAANAAEVDLGREETDDFAARVPVDKLVFVVHGIGQVTRSFAHHDPLISRLTACNSCSALV